MSSGTRRRARCYALQVLFALDLNPTEDADDALVAYHSEFELEVEPSSLDFGKRLVRAVVASATAIDEVIQQASRNWRIERMSRVDRNILRLATGELRHVKEAPVRVVINEAVELAKLYGASESAAFVNGILDRVAQVPATPPAAALEEASGA